MSAQPEFARIPDDELDLLLSRSLDGDLSPEEQASLERYLETHPDARRRREALTGLVEDLGALPSPEPPFALSTRVNSQVTERSKGLDSKWHRFGIYPPPGTVAAAAVVLAFVAILAALLGKGAPRPQAPPAPLPEESSGPVHVFFQDPATAPNVARALAWSAEVAAPGGAPAAWRLAKEPWPEPPTVPLEGRVLLSLDAEGRVLAVRELLLPAGAERARLENALRVFVFERVGPGGTEVELRLRAR